MIVRPFRALRPLPQFAKKVAALPYDVMNTEEARETAAGNPHSFLHVDKAEIDLPPETDPYSQAVYDKAKENLDKLVNDGVMAQDSEPALYIYQLKGYGRVQTGLAACVSVDEYEKELIKRHEFTRPDKEADRVNHIKTCGAHTGPIFMAYRDAGQRSLMADWINKYDPIYDFTADDGIKHTMWMVNDAAAQDGLIKSFAELPNFYIADGHHRNEAARKAATTGESRYYLAALFPHDELSIMDYNRVVTEAPDNLMEKVKKAAAVEESTVPVKPESKHVAGMYVNGRWYRLTFTTDSKADVISGLDVSVLQNKILSPIFGINDPKTDKRIDFVGGIRGTEELERRVNSGEMAAAFSMYPTSMDELLAVADANQIMPPKSTWFEPKLRSGLLVHLF